MEGVLVFGQDAVDLPAGDIDTQLMQLLQEERLVLCDRYLDATLAYQGYGRGLDLDMILTLHCLETLGKVWTGVGPFTHNDPRDRPPAIFGGDVTLHAGPDRSAHVLLPVIPKR